MVVTLDQLIQNSGEEVLLNDMLKEAGMIRRNSPKCPGCGAVNLSYKTDLTGSCLWYDRYQFLYSTIPLNWSYEINCDGSLPLF